MGKEHSLNETFPTTPTKTSMEQASVLTPSPQVHRVQRNSKSSHGKNTSSTTQPSPAEKQEGSLRFGPAALKKFVSNFFNEVIQVEDFKIICFDTNTRKCQRRI